MKKGLKRTPEEVARWRERQQFIERVVQRAWARRHEVPDEEARGKEAKG